MISALIDERYPVQIPQTFGHYTYVRQIGSGAFSVVILCEHVKTHIQYACKVVSRDLLVEEKTFDRFEQEVRIVQSLSHPSIVKIEELVFQEKLIFVVMEYCVRGDLFNYIVKNGSLADFVIKRMLRQLLEALAYIHERKLAHRDIKPENILINAAGNAKLGDFGLCHSTANQKLLTTPCGSPLYAPPEIISGQPYDGQKADMWSIGVVLFTMCTGSLPWAESNQSKLLQQIVDNDYIIPLTVAPVFRDLIEQLMQTDPNKRPEASELLKLPFLYEVPQLVVSAPIPRKKKPQKLRAYSFGIDQPIRDIDPSQDEKKDQTSNVLKKKLIVRPDVSKRKTLASSLELSPIIGLVRKVPQTNAFKAGKIEQLAE